MFCRHALSVPIYAPADAVNHLHCRLTPLKAVMFSAGRDNPRNRP